jgi:hypothetical protein
MKLPIALLVVAVVAIGCTREGDENANEGANATGDISAAIEVELTDEGIQMPDEIPGGLVLFEVANSGTVPHGFAIEGVDATIEELNVDELETLEIELAPGTYTVFSPSQGDREAGLERQLTVTEPGPSTNPDPGGEGIGPSEQQDPMDDD